MLYTSGYSENAVIHNNRLDPDILLLTKPYRRSELARMIRLALASNRSRSASRRRHTTLRDTAGFDRRLIGCDRRPFNPRSA